MEQSAPGSWVTIVDSIAVEEAQVDDVPREASAKE